MQRIEAQPVVEAVERLARTDARAYLAQLHDRLHYLPVIADAPNGEPLGVLVRSSSDAPALRDMR
jgi:hypothetical protein